MITRKLVPVLGISVALLAACTDQVPEIPASELYTRAFVKEFGVVNGSQDWNNATQGSVNVSVEGQAAVQVTAKINGRYYLLANYAGVTGQRTLKFDMPRGVEDIIVRAGGESVHTKVGSTVAFASSGRAFYPGTSSTPSGDIVISEADQADWRLIPYADVMGYENVMPEGKINIYNPAVTLDFVFRSVGDIIIYPIYWDTSATNELGIAYKDESGVMQHIPIYSNYHSNEFDMSANLMGLTAYPDEYIKRYSIQDIFNDEDVREIVGDREIIDGRKYGELTNCSEDFYALTNALTAKEYNELSARKVGDEFATALALNNSNLVNGAPIDKDYWSSGYCEITYLCKGAKYDDSYSIMGPGSGNSAVSNGDFTNIRTQHKGAIFSKGVKVSVPIGMRYGMYIKNGNYGTFYSVCDENEDKRVERDADGKPTTNPVTYLDEGAYHAATWIGPKYGWRWLAFEDCKTSDENGTNVDINDMVFLIANAVQDDDTPNDPPVEIEDPDEPVGEPIKWLIACEDLGAIDDFDFNDVVFEVEYVAGENKAKITPLAAGGTLETYLMRGDEVISGEWHSYFGGASYTQMMNTTTITHHPEPFEIDVDPDNFSISSSLEGEGYRKNMGDFHIKVVRANGDQTNITPPGPGEAPQMMLIFQPEGKPWRWPIERHHIKSAYPKFTDWISTGKYEVIKDGENWFDTATDMHVIAR